MASHGWPWSAEPKVDFALDMPNPRRNWKLTFENENVQTERFTQFSIIAVHVINIVCQLAGVSSSFIFWCFGIMISRPFFHTTELSTNSLGEFVARWNYDFHTVSIHSGAFNQFPGGFCGVLKL